MKNTITIAILLLSFYANSQITHTEYTYDNQNRLIKVIYDNEDIVEYEYDVLGNRTQKEYIVTQLTYVPDDNFEQALIDLGYDDVLDDYVITSNISSIETLNISNYNISDLTGIEDFSSLWGFICSNNNLSSIDLSLNNNLKELYCSDNNLTDINISNNLLLETLNCNNNQLSSLDISNNSNLIFLAITNNNFSNLNLSDNLNLLHIYIKDNNFTSLDLSNHSNLISVSCSNNNLTYLNLKNGNNQALNNVWVTNNPNLNCIQVDDEVSANNGIGVYANWNIEPYMSYSEDCSLSINSLYLYNNVSIFPNPTNSIICIDNPLNIKFVQIKISNVIGQIIYKSHLVKNKIDISNFINGTYFMELKDENNRKVVYKIIKK